MKKRIIALGIVGFLLVSCSDPDLKTVASALEDTARGVGVLQSTVINAADRGVISESTTRPLLEFALSVNRAGKVAIAVTKEWSKLEKNDRAQLLKILEPLLEKLQDSDSFVLANVQDPKARREIQAALSLIQASLGTAQLVLVSKGQ